VAKGPDLIVLSAVLAASLTPTELPAQSTAPAAPPEAAAPASPAQPPSPAPTPAAPSTDPVPPAPDAPRREDGQTLPATPGTSEIVVSGEHKMQKMDPVAAANKVSFEAMQSVDRALVGPIAHVYRDALPGPLRKGLHNFFYNLNEPVNALNYVLQLHPGKALQTVARFGINSTIGVAGLFDLAKKKPFNIHYRPNGFENTMGYWGIGNGPYFFLPLIGATTLRDLVGTLLDQAVLPTVVGKPFNNRYFVGASGLIIGLDYRVIIDADLNKVRNTDSPYSNYRQAYLRTRYWEIEALHGRGPLAKGEIGEAPFAHPLVPEPDAATPAPAPAAPDAAASTPQAVAPVAPAGPPPPPVFISQPVIQPHPVIQPLPSGYRPGGS
jgi:phospholipid-binding lipoprotein MlaA